MFDVIAVVEQQQVVNASVVARRAARMLVMAVHRTKQQTGDITGHVGGCEEPGRVRCERRPEREHECDLQDQLARDAQARSDARVVREMTVAPERLRYAG